MRNISEPESVIISEMLTELDGARERYPEWQQNIVEACAVMVEEAGEVLKAVNNHRWQHGDDSVEDIRKETIQTMAMCMRFLLDTKEFC